MRENPPTQSNRLPAPERVELLRTMIRIREFEDMVGESYLRGHTAGSMLHLSVGEEAAAAGIVKAMVPEDLFTTHHRGHGVFLARGADPMRMFAEVFGKSVGYCKGKGGSMHIADIKLGHMGANAIVGANIPISLGGGFSLKYRDVPGVSVAFFGDGAINQGVLYESMNMAALWKLPVLFAVINNQYGMGTRVDLASASLAFAERAETFGVKGAEVDGMDVEAVYAQADSLLRYCREGNGPALLVAHAYRFYGHGRKDPSPYRTKEEEAEWKARDPIPLYRDRLTAEEVITAEAAAQIAAEAAAEMEEAVAVAVKQADPAPEELYTDLFVEEL
jgi:acetoin:2,6-dichlorophenolindophenol oxidoreductase subunit alpha